MLEKVRHYLPLLLIILLALVLRLSWLDRVPVGITGDELDYAFNAKAVFLTGRDITGTWSPFSLTTPPGETPKAELPYLLFAPFIGVADFSLFNVRFPHVLVNVLLLVIIYLIAYELFSKRVAVFAALVGAVNPWAIYFGRTAYEVPLSVLLFLVSFYILMKVKGWKILYSFPFLLLALYLYIGAKLWFMPFMLISSIYAYWFVNKRRFLKQYLVLLVTCLLVFVYFVSLLQSSSVGTRSSELLTPYSSDISVKVDQHRKLAVQTPITNMFENKIVIYTKEIVERYFGLFSTQHLFLTGESVARYSTWRHGVFYYIDVIFLFLGFAALLKKKKSIVLLFVALLLVALLPALLSSVDRSYGIRAALVFPLLFIVAALGLAEFGIYIKNKLVWIGIGVIYCLSILNYFNIYLFENPIYNAEAFAISERILSRYVDLASKSDQQVVILAEGEGALFKQYLFYTNGYSSKTKDEIRSIYNNGEFKLNNVYYAGCNTDVDIPENSVVITFARKECGNLPEGDHLSISQLSDGGEVYRIYNDNICSKYPLSRSPSNFSLGDFMMENLDEQHFCQKYIMNL